MKRIIILSLLVSSIYTSEVVHKFKSPSFSGISTSSHYLTIENQQKSRRDKIADDLESAIAAAERDAEGTTGWGINGMYAFDFATLSAGVESVDSGTTAEGFFVGLSFPEVGAGSFWKEMTNLAVEGPGYIDTALSNVENSWP